ncbi:MAG TPA: ParB/RepB/Spo0J family partition protein [Steroidobacteraceae bacterium]
MKGNNADQLIISVDPFRCRMWTQHDRIQENISVESCREEIASFRLHGQLVPALGRRLYNDPTHDIELICGARRHFVACHLNVALRVELRNLDDRACIIAMDIENRLRRNISIYERGVSYTAWMRNGLFSSQDEIARALKLSASHVSRARKIAALPAVIINSFESPTQIREEWGLALALAMEDPSRRESMIRRARELVRPQEKLQPLEVYRRLIGSIPKKTSIACLREEIVRCRDGKPLFRIKPAPNSVVLMLPAERISRKRLGEIRSFLRIVLEEDTPVETETCCETVEGTSQTWRSPQIPPSPVSS